MVLDSKSTCPICLFELTDDDVTEANTVDESHNHNNNAVTTVVCGHSYHTECLTAFCCSEIKNGQSKITCCVVDDANSRCYRPLSDPMVKKLVPAETFNKYCKWKLRSEHAKDFAECPYCETQDIFQSHEQDPIVECQSCLKKFCFTHGRAHPLTTTCAQFELNHYKKNMDEINTIAQTCPGCSQRIERGDGCNKMVCSECNTPFCYLCGTDLTTLRYTHFNDGTVYNKLFGCHGMLYHKSLPRWIYYTRYTYNSEVFYAAAFDAALFLIWLLGLVRPIDILAFSYILLNAFWNGSCFKRTMDRCTQVYSACEKGVFDYLRKHIKCFNIQRIYGCVMAIEFLFKIGYYVIFCAEGKVWYAIFFLQHMQNIWKKLPQHVHRWQRRHMTTVQVLLRCSVILIGPFIYYSWFMNMATIFYGSVRDADVPYFSCIVFQKLMQPYTSVMECVSLFTWLWTDKIHYFFKHPYTSFTMVTELRAIAPVLDFYTFVITGEIFSVRIILGSGVVDIGSWLFHQSTALYGVFCSVISYVWEWVYHQCGSYLLTTWILPFLSVGLAPVAFFAELYVVPSVMAVYQQFQCGSYVLFVWMLSLFSLCLAPGAFFAELYVVPPVTVVYQLVIESPVKLLTSVYSYAYPMKLLTQITYYVLSLPFHTLIEPLCRQFGQLVYVPLSYFYLAVVWGGSYLILGLIYYPVSYVYMTVVWTCTTCIYQPLIFLRFVLTHPYWVGEKIFLVFTCLVECFKTYWLIFCLLLLSMLVFYKWWKNPNRCYPSCCHEPRTTNADRRYRRKRRKNGGGHSLLSPVPPHRYLKQQHKTKTY